MHYVVILRPNQNCSEQGLTSLHCQIVQLCYYSLAAVVKTCPY